MADQGSDLPDIPEALAAPKSSRTVQAVWLIPLLAALIGGWLAVKAILEQGPTVTITFKTAEGIEAGKTKLRYKDVEIGLVKAVVVAEDRKDVIVTAELVKATERGLVEDTRFWVVRPRISGGSVSGLGTLIAGAYIGVDPGNSPKKRRDFVGLEVPPVIATDAPGREFVLKSADLASLDVGSPIFFRRLQVGQISAYELDKDGKGVTFKVFVNEPYDRFVNPNTRFWQASGVDVTLDASGIRVETQSLVSVLIGGIAFGTPLDSSELPPAAANAEFRLFPGRAEAMKNPEALMMRLVMEFNESVRGLAPGAPLDFRGIELGSVTAVKAEFGVGGTKGSEAGQINMVVEANMFPDRLRTRLVTARAAAQDEAARIANITALVVRGLRAQLRTGNLLTGQLYVALDFFPDAPRITKLAIREGQLHMPTTPSGQRELQATIAAIAAKIQSFPLEEIGADLRQTLGSANRAIEKLPVEQLSADLRQTLASANRLMQRLDSEVTPEAAAALADVRRTLANADRMLSSESALQQDAREAMREVGRAAQAFRILADYLERHPEALITGKKGEQK